VSRRYYFLNLLPVIFDSPGKIYAQTTSAAAGVNQVAGALRDFQDHPGNNFGISTDSFNRCAQRAACNPRRLSRGPLGTAVKR
jgi:hypothetical protein